MIILCPFLVLEHNAEERDLDQRTPDEAAGGGTEFQPDARNGVSAVPRIHYAYCVTILYAYDLHMARVGMQSIRPEYPCSTPRGGDCSVFCHLAVQYSVSTVGSATEWDLVRGMRGN